MSVGWISFLGNADPLGGIRPKDFSAEYSLITEFHNIEVAANFPG